MITQKTIPLLKIAVGVIFSYALIIQAQQSEYIYDPSGNTTVVLTAAGFSPVIEAQPRNQVFQTNGIESFSVVASGSGLSYQWLSNGVAIAGATGDSLLFANLASAPPGSFSVVISNASGVVTSTPVAIWINTNAPSTNNVPPLPPFLASIAPASQIAAPGGNATFTVAASGTPPFSYQWQFNGMSLVGLTNVFVSSTGILTVSNATSGNEGVYSVTVSNMAGEVSSADAILTFQSQQSQNLILNGSFESPVVTANSYQTATPTYWNWTGGTSGYIFNGIVTTGAYWPPPENGQQFVDIGPNSYGPLSQTFTVTNQGNYQLSWFDSVGQSGGLMTAPYSVAILTATLQTVSSNNFDSYNASSAWVPRSVELTLDPGTYTLRFGGLGAYGGLNALIDNVFLGEFSAIQSAPVIAWDNPAPINYGTALSSSQLNAVANIAGSFVYSPTNGTVLPAGSNALSVVFYPTDTANYSSMTDIVSIVVFKATPVVTWPAPSFVAPGTALTTNQLDATATVPGTFVYYPAIGTVLPIGTNELSVLFTPTDTVDYTSVTDSVSLVVLAALGLPSLTYDLTSEFSTSSNPNGVWSYDENNVPITQKQAPSYGTGWGYYSSEDSSILQFNANASGFDTQVGDVVMHAPSVPYGGPTAYLNINWTSPANGVISITGRAWDDAIAAGRDANWSLSVGGMIIASRSSVYGLYRTNAAAQFSNNVVPGDSLTGIAVKQGEVVEIAVAADTYYGHFVGVQEDITLYGVAPVIQTAQQTGNSLTFSWSALTNQMYQIQTTPSLASANWTNLGGSITASNSIVTTSVPIGTNAQQFFRVVLFP